VRQADGTCVTIGAEKLYSIKRLQIFERILLPSLHLVYIPSKEFFLVDEKFCKLYNISKAMQQAVHEALGQKLTSQQCLNRPAPLRAQHWTIDKIKPQHAMSAIVQECEEVFLLRQQVNSLQKQVFKLKSSLALKGQQLKKSAHLRNKASNNLVRH
jgi:hypothetical protein